MFCIIDFQPDVLPVCPTDCGTHAAMHHIVSFLCPADEQVYCDVSRNLNDTAYRPSSKFHLTLRPKDTTVYQLLSIFFSCTTARFDSFLIYRFFLFVAVFHIYIDFWSDFAYFRIIIDNDFQECLIFPYFVHLCTVSFRFLIDTFSCFSQNTV